MNCKKTFYTLKMLKSCLTQGESRQGKHIKFVTVGCGFFSFLVLVLGGAGSGSDNVIFLLMGAYFQLDAKIWVRSKLNSSFGGV